MGHDIVLVHICVKCANFVSKRRLVFPHSGRIDRQIFRITENN